MPDFPLDPRADDPALDPVDRFALLLEAAVRVDRALLPEPTAFTLATVGEDGRPSARVMLLKAADARGFVFYTNGNSRKGRELATAGVAALTFHWQLLERQVRVEGPVTPVSGEEADEYFASRPRGSQLGAWASLQSQPMAHDGALDERLAAIERQYAGGPVPRPPHWGGWRLAPDRIEFWRNMPSRLHVRHRYEREGDDGAWRVERLYP